MGLVIALLDDKDRRKKLDSRQSECISRVDTCRSLAAFFVILIAGIERNLLPVRFVIVARTRCCKLFLSSPFLGCRIAYIPYRVRTEQVRSVSRDSDV